MTTFPTDPASGSRKTVAYIEENIWGIHPSPANMFKFRHTGANFPLSKPPLESQEIRSDRQVQDFRLGNESVTGTLPFELSYGAMDDWLAAALFGAWTNEGAGTPNTLKGGTTFTSFSVEEQYEDVVLYRPLYGVVPNTLSLSIAPNAMVTGSFGVIGKGQGDIIGASFGNAPSDVALNSPFDSFTGTIEEGGATVAVVTSVELTLDNGIAPQFVVGSKQAAVVDIGRSRLTGTITAFFISAALFNKFVNETESSLSLTLIDPANANRTLTIDIPRIKYTGGDLPNAGESRQVVSLPFQALLDSGQDTNIVLTRSNPA